MKLPESDQMKRLRRRLGLTRPVAKFKSPFDTLPEVMQPNEAPNGGLAMDNMDEELGQPTRKQYVPGERHWRDADGPGFPDGY